MLSVPLSTTLEISPSAEIGEIKQAYEKRKQQIAEEDNDKAKKKL
jgi:hypothetical protein